MVAVTNPAAGASEGPDSALASFAQQRLWFLEQLEPDSALYNMPSAWRIHGVLDPEALRRSLEAVVRRHESLRTTFATAAHEVVQIIAPAAALALPLHDLAMAPDPEASVQRLIAGHALRPFDLAQGPLWRAGLLRVRSDEHVLWLVLHHIVSDGWSTGVLLRELGEGYAAALTSRAAALAPLPIQYADFAAWQRDLLQGPALQRQLGYWQRVLDGAPPALELPLVRPRPALPGHQGAVHSIPIGKEIATGLREVCRSTRSTPFMVLITAFATLLSRYSGQHDVCIGYPVANRQRAELEPLIGFFVNTLVLRLKPEPGKSFQHLLAETREAVLDADVCRELPFEQVVEALAPQRHAGRSPLFQVLFSYDAAAPALSLPGLRTESIPCRNELAKFELALGVSERDEGLVATFSYATALFDARTIARLARHYVVLLAAAVAEPHADLACLPLLEASERDWLLQACNDTVAEFPHERCLHELFEAQARLQPGAVAVACGSRQLSYAEIDARAEAVATLLQRLGVGAESLVPICAERSPELVIGLLGILKTGAAYVPLDPSWPAARQQQIVRRLRATTLVATRGLLPRLQLALQGEVRDVCVPDGGSEENGATQWRVWSPDSVEGDVRTAVSSDPRRRAYVIFTSGSTGEPKGVVLSHAPVVNLIEWVNRRLDIGPRDRMLFVTSPCFDLSVYDVFGMLAAGGCVDVVPQAMLDEPAAFADYARDRPVTFWDSAPAALRFLTQLMPVAPGSTIAQSLRTVFLSGDWIPLDAPERLRALFPRAQLVALGGATEAAIWSNAYFVRSVDADWRSIPYGRPIQNARYYVLDGHLEPVPVGVAGDLYIGGECLALGYFDDAAQTAGSFLPDPHAVRAGARMYRTGDRACFLADGNIEFLGRVDHQVKVRGYRVELGEIEAALLRTTGVREAVVVARRDARDEVRLVAYVVPDADACRRVEPLDAGLRAALPDYMVPTAWVWLEALPLNANGKIDRQRLPPAGSSANAQDAGYVAPRSDTERVLAAIWAEVLQVERVGIHDNFFALGGYSLKIVQVVALLRSRHGCELAVREVFGTRNLEELAARVGRIAEGGASGCRGVPAPRQARHPAPSRYRASRRVADEILWNDLHLDSRSAWFQYQFAVQLHGTLEPSAVRRALAAVVARHPVLTARFAIEDDAVWMEECGFDVLEFSVLELRDRAGADPLEAARTLLRQQPRRAFDRFSGPLCRFTVVPLPQGSVLFAQIDHALFDLQSQDLLLRDLSQALRAEREGRSWQAASDAPRFADYCQWHRTVLDDAAWARLQAYWHSRFPRPVKAYDALFGQPRAEAGDASPRWRQHQWRLGAAHCSQVATLCGNLGVTPLVLLLAGLRWWALEERGVTEFEIETDVLGRIDPAFNRTVGFFSTNLVFRFATTPVQALREIVADTAHHFADGLAHQELPFFSLKRIANPDLNPDNFHWPIKFSQQTSVLDGASWRDEHAPELSPLALTMPGGGAHPLCIYLTGEAGDWCVDGFYDSSRVADDTMPSLVRAWEQALAMLHDEAISAVA